MAIWVRMFFLLLPYHAKHAQSPKKRLFGSPSRKKNRNPRSLSLRRQSHQAAQRENLPRRKGKEALLVSSRKLELKPLDSLLVVRLEVPSYIGSSE
jgi:hypothetical protein